MSQQRSPNYPRKSLLSSIKDARILYQKEKTAKFASEVAAKALGYTGMNGLVRMRLAAMKQYGLLDTDKKGGVFKLSKRALTILLRPENHAERQNEISLAALEPSLFKKFQQENPTASDDSLKFELVANEGFTGDGAQTFLKVFRNTLAYAFGHGETTLPNDRESDKTEWNRTDSGLSEKLSTHEFKVGDYVQWLSQGVYQFPTPQPIVRFSDDQTHAFFGHSQTGAPVKDLEKFPSPDEPEPPPHEERQTMNAPVNYAGPRQIGSAIPVSPECSISIIAMGSVTQEAIEKLRDYLKLCKESFPTAACATSQNEGSSQDSHSTGD